MRPRTAAGLVVGLVAQVLATAKLPPANEGQTFAFDTVFGVDFSTDANGGCKSHKDKLQTSHVEAISTLTAAKGSIDWLSQHKKAPSSSNKELYNNWLRVRQTYQKVLGTDPWTAAGGLAQEVNAVRQTFEKYLSRLQVPEKTTTPKYHIRCRDDWIKFLKPTDPDPREAGKPDAKQYTLAKRMISKVNHFLKLRSNVYDVVRAVVLKAMVSVLYSEPEASTTSRFISSLQYCRCDSTAQLRAVTMCELASTRVRLAKYVQPAAGSPAGKPEARLASYDTIDKRDVYDSKRYEGFELA
ncbi:hypothetical protein CLAFUW4_12193 [Fulvia fulva]|uniref:Uncharacterized protein n=1 Tax=Passalora fulva TaxID=5499 RepID=A0A9Q8USX9_PASFU|nr:uncharacterized protein CLAFUR5_11230 [Fulvia fulva]KAK4619102.1 hypothetical protein CLAFUR0_12209 [Fulvia fulva]UJO21266.1 hypothetical protein CLAFUR5_11230 [Fulvia fulva]WPV17856.1 hypothetical protein CLAFUW4_12193 [Fulvia fulva]WPV32883.1 hypothetical protein CLAFUW7_12200 [Fulvia fulva]